MTLQVFAVLAAVVVATWLLSSFRTRLIYEGSAGLLYRNGRFVRQLPPGLHRDFDPLHRSRLITVPTHPVALPPRSLTLVSRDQFSFRVMLVPIVQVTDPRSYQESIGFEPGGSQRTALQFGTGFQAVALDAALAAEMLALASQQTLEDFIASHAPLLDALPARLGTAASGIAVERVLVTEVTVPPEVRKMFTEVERARREGLAQLERARAEQASLRALANAARTLQDNPRLAELRMLQLMEGAKGNKTFVLGQPRLDTAADTTDTA